MGKIVAGQFFKIAGTKNIFIYGIFNAGVYKKTPALQKLAKFS
jgi:hypothetical protein